MSAERYLLSDTPRLLTVTASKLRPWQFTPYLRTKEQTFEYLLDLGMISLSSIQVFSFLMLVVSGLCWTQICWLGRLNPKWLGIWELEGVKKSKSLKIWCQGLSVLFCTGLVAWSQLLIDLCIWERRILYGRVVPDNVVMISWCATGLSLASFFWHLGTAGYAVFKVANASTTKSCDRQRKNGTMLKQAHSHYNDLNDCYDEKDKDFYSTIEAPL